MLLFDNDIIHKLAAFDLLEYTVSLLPPSKTIQYLAAAKYVLKSKAKPEHYDRILDFIALDKVCLLPDLPVLEEVTTLHIEVSKVKNIDDGEAVLISSLLTDSGEGLITGDKRCLEALAKSDIYKKYADKIDGKTCCLEQVIWLLQEQDFERVRHAVVSEKDCDKTLSSIFTRMDVSKEDVEAGLNSYISDLRRKTKNLLCDAKSFSMIFNEK